MPATQALAVPSCVCTVKLHLPPDLLLLPYLSPTPRCFSPSHSFGVICYEVLHRYRMSLAVANAEEAQVRSKGRMHGRVGEVLSSGGDGAGEQS